MLYLTAASGDVTERCLVVKFTLLIIFLSNTEIKTQANGPDEDGLANLLMASPSCGPLDKQQQAA